MCQRSESETGNTLCDAPRGVRFAIHDARGIFCTYACEKCETIARARYRPEIFRNPAYRADEPIDGDE